MIESDANNPTSLSDPLLLSFMQTFYGYGAWSAPWWFVGMEEGGGTTVGELNRRLNVWERRGRCDLEDLAEYHQEIGVAHYFGARPKLQRTWSSLIRAMLCARGLAPSREEVRRYQAEELGRHSAESCLIELSPLPSPNVSKWIYSRASNLPELASRQKYFSAFAPRRSARLRELVDRYRPKIVLFYGSSYEKWWREVAGIELSVDDRLRVSSGHRSGTYFVVADHPAARGLRSGYFDAVGHYCAQRLS